MTRKTSSSTTAEPPVMPLLSVAVALVFGGCCTNAWSLERLLKDNPSIGTALTFCQLIFITLQTAPACISLRPYPRFKPPVVPIRTWLSQVVVLTSMSLLSNWAFAYRVPLTLQIVFRSAGLAVSMILGYIFLKKTYSYLQVVSVVVVTLGVLVATLARPTATPATRVSDGAFTPGHDASSAAEIRDYTIGIAMLAGACVLTSTLGILQETTFAKYGANTWREGIFYTHLLSLPTFFFLMKDVKSGLHALTSAAKNGAQPPPLLYLAGIPPLYYVLAMNVVSQSVCVSGANLLTSAGSAVTTNLILTARKASSLCISVWYFGQGLNAGLAFGAIVVLLGTLLYSYATTAAKRQQAEEKTGMSTSSSTILNREWEKGGRGLIPSSPTLENGSYAIANGHPHEPEPATTPTSPSPIQSRTRELRRRGPDGKVVNGASVSPTPEPSQPQPPRKSRRKQTGIDGAEGSD